MTKQKNKIRNNGEGLILKELFSPECILEYFKESFTIFNQSQ